VDDEERGELVSSALFPMPPDLCRAGATSDAGVGLYYEFRIDQERIDAVQVGQLR